MAAGGPGGRPVTPDPGGSRVRTNIVLYVLALLTACACVLVTVTVVRAIQDDDTDASSRAEGELEPASSEEQQRYDDVTAAAAEFATALVNIRHDDFEASSEAVRALATGAFADQYEKSANGLVKLVRRSKAVMTGEVVWAGVVSADEDAATVIVATNGTVANAQTGNEPVARTFRLQVQLTQVDGDWLTSDLLFVEELA
jgi:Mce-associated membrane protein